MRKIINNLRNQPEEVRMHVVHLSVIVAGIILVSLWLVSIGGVVKESQTAQAESSTELKPFTAIKDNFVEGYKSISATAVETVE